MKYLYESHLGGLYSTDHELSMLSLYCDQCGDSDDKIGEFESIADFWNLIKDDCDIDGSGGWSLQYIYPYIISEFGLPDDAEYEDEYYKDCMSCCNTQEWILNRIKELTNKNG